MSEDRRTKAQLLAALDVADKHIVEVEARAKEARRIDPEADALDSCIRALAPFSERDTYSSDNGKRKAVARILDHLATRFNAPPPGAPDNELVYLSRRVQELESEKQTLQAHLASIAEVVGNSPVPLLGLQQSTNGINMAWGGRP